MTPMLARMINAHQRLNATSSRRIGAERVLAKSQVDEQEAWRNSNAILAEATASPEHADDVAAFNRWLAAQTPTEAP